MSEYTHSILLLALNVESENLEREREIAELLDRCTTNAKRNQSMKSWVWVKTVSKCPRDFDTYPKDACWEECFAESKSENRSWEVWGTRQSCFCSRGSSCEPVSLAHDRPQIPYIPWRNNARTPLAWAFWEGWMNSLHQVCPVPHDHPICIIYARCLSSLRSVPVITTDQSERTTAGQPRERCCCYLCCKDRAHLKLNLWRKMKREGLTTHALSPQG